MHSIRHYINLVEYTAPKAPAPEHPFNTLMKPHFTAQADYQGNKKPNQREYYPKPNAPVRLDSRFGDGELHGQLTKNGYTRTTSAGAANHYTKGSGTAQENLHVTTQPGTGHVTSVVHHAVGA